MTSQSHLPTTLLQSKQPSVLIFPDDNYDLEQFRLQSSWQIIQQEFKTALHNHAP